MSKVIMTFRCALTGETSSMVLCQKHAAEHMADARSADPDATCESCAAIERHATRKKAKQ